MYDDYDDYDDFLDDYNYQLEELEQQEEDAFDIYESQVDQIDEYWDRENEYIINSGIYTNEEVQQILANHGEIRKTKKKEAREMYEFEKETIRFDREQVEFNRQMAESDREIDRILKQAEPVYSHQPVPQYERPSLLERAFAFAGAYYFFEKIFNPKK